MLFEKILSKVIQDMFVNNIYYIIVHYLLNMSLELFLS